MEGQVQGDMQQPEDWMQSFAWPTLGGEEQSSTSSDTWKHEASGSVSTCNFPVTFAGHETNPQDVNTHPFRGLGQGSLGLASVEFPSSNALLDFSYAASPHAFGYDFSNTWTPGASNSVPISDQANKASFDCTQQFQEQPAWYLQSLRCHTVSAEMQDTHTGSATEYDWHGNFHVDNLGGFIVAHDIAMPSAASAAAGGINSNVPAIQKKDKKAEKERVPCEYKGCRKTFKRRYEMERHMNNIHKRVDLYCPVYGCSRTTKPFARLDKLKEHLKKHTSPDNFNCLVNDCHSGPMNTAELRDHLISHGEQNGHLDQPYLYDIVGFFTTLNGLKLKERQHIAKERSKNRDTCPLISLGCTFRLSVEFPYMIYHVWGHELADRVTVASELELDGLDRGIAICPLCKKQICEEIECVSILGHHIMKNHSANERAQHAAELSRICAPFLARQMWYFADFEAIHAELKNGGLLSET